MNKKFTQLILPILLVSFGLFGAETSDKKRKPADHLQPSIQARSSQVTEKNKLQNIYRQLTHCCFGTRDDGIWINGLLSKLSKDQKECFFNKKVSPTDSTQQTLLDYVCLNNKKNICKAFLNHGANPNLYSIYNEDGYKILKTALFTVSENNNNELAELLLRHGSNPNLGMKSTCIENGQILWTTPLFEAFRTPSAPLINLLLNHPQIDVFKGFYNNIESTFISNTTLSIPSFFGFNFNENGVEKGDEYFSIFEKLIKKEPLVVNTSCVILPEFNEEFFSITESAEEEETTISPFFSYVVRCNNAQSLVPLLVLNEAIVQAPIVTGLENNHPVGLYEEDSLLLACASTKEQETTYGTELGWCDNYSESLNEKLNDVNFCVEKMDKEELRNYLVEADPFIIDGYKTVNILMDMGMKTTSDIIDLNYEEIIERAQLIHKMDQRHMVLTGSPSILVDTLDLIKFEDLKGRLKKKKTGVMAALLKRQRVGRPF